MISVFSAYGNSGYRQNSISSISNFLKNFTFLGFHGVVLVKTIPLMYQLLVIDRTDIDEAMVISALRQKSKFEFRTFLKKKNPIFGFPWCSTSEDLSIDVSITNVGLILKKLR